jgi:hypothetical protein
MEATSTPLDRPTDEQIWFAQHLLELVRRLPPNRILCMRAGELRRLLQDLPGAGEELTPTEKPATVKVVYARQMRLASGEPLRRIETFLAQCPEPQRAKTIAEYCDLNYTTVCNVLSRGPFERDGLDPMLWRRRTVRGVPLSSAQ